MSKPRPILFLDVDGVLNILTPDFSDREVRFKHRMFEDGIPFFPTKHTLPFMRWAWANFQVIWCTAWGADANLIASWAELPEMPSIDDRAREEWKLAGVKEILSSRGAGQHAVWIEDGIGDAAEEWVATQKDVIYVETFPVIGVSKEHALMVADCLDLGMEDWK